MMTPGEKYAFELVSKDVKTVFDVGARMDEDYMKHKSDCDFHLFEPNPSAAKILREIAKKYESVTVNEFGLSDIDRDAVPYDTVISSFLKHPFPDIAESQTFTEKIDVKTIDRYCEEKKIKKIDFLKIDAEGMDYAILLGAKKMISRDSISYIQFEYWDGVRKFVDLLSEKYNMYFIAGEEGLRELSEDVIQYIDTDRIPAGAGGDIFCVHKSINLP